MYNITLSISQKEELSSLLHSEKNNKIYRRLQCIHFKDIGLKHSIIASSLSVHIDTITDWLKLFNIAGFEGLCKLDYDNRRISKLDSVQSQMKQYIDDNMIGTISQLQSYLLSAHQINIEQSWLFRYCKKNSIHLTKKHF